MLGLGQLRYRSVEVLQGIVELADAIEHQRPLLQQDATIVQIGQRHRAIQQLEAVPGAPLLGFGVGQANQQPGHQRVVLGARRLPCGVLFVPAEQGQASSQQSSTFRGTAVRGRGHALAVHAANRSLDVRHHYTTNDGVTTDLPCWVWRSPWVRTTSWASPRGTCLSTKQPRSSASVVSCPFDVRISIWWLRVGANQPSSLTVFLVAALTVIMIVRLSLSNVMVRLCSSPRAATDSSSRIRETSASMSSKASANRTRSTSPGGIGSMAVNTSAMSRRIAMSRSSIGSSDPGGEIMSGEVITGSSRATTATGYGVWPGTGRGSGRCRPGTGRSCPARPPHSRPPAAAGSPQAPVPGPAARVPAPCWASLPLLLLLAFERLELDALKRMDRTVYRSGLAGLAMAELFRHGGCAFHQRIGEFSGQQRRCKGCAAPDGEAAGEVVRVETLPEQAIDRCALVRIHGTTGHWEGADHRDAWRVAEHPRYLVAEVGDGAVRVECADADDRRMVTLSRLASQCGRVKLAAAGKVAGRCHDRDTGRGHLVQRGREVVPHRDLEAGLREEAHGQRNDVDRERSRVSGLRALRLVGEVGQCEL